jgi:hypothetical protein
MGLWRAAAVTAGAVAVGAAIMLGGRTGEQTTQRMVSPVAPAAVNVAPGVQAPLGVDINSLPAGYRDYIRPELQARTQNVAPGVQAPLGVDINSLPAGYRDYIRPELQARTQAAPFVAPGVQAPLSVDIDSLPAGYRDYIRSGR